MKNIEIILCVISLFLFLNPAAAQRAPLVSVGGMQVTEIGVSSNPSSQIVLMGNSRADVLAKLGSPTSIENYYFEMDEIMGERIFYGSSSRVCVTEDRLSSFYLVENSLSVVYRNKYIKVGDPVSKVTEMDPSVENFKKTNRYSIKLLFGETEQTDERLIIYFNVSTNLITKILYHRG